MDLTAGNGQQAGFACRCLNTRISPRTPPHPPPESVHPDYTPTFVGEDGISVAHTQLTLRSRTKSREENQGDESKLTRYISLTCLVCQTLIYRVHQVITPDLDGDEGPVQPTEDWAEDDLLKTSSGWIEVFKDCISGEAISQAEASPLYSSIFRVVLPSGDASTASIIPSYSTHSQSTPQSSPTTSTLKQHLPPLPPLFLPPPFTPSHTVFRHIFSVATDESLRLRDAAEEHISRIVQEKVQELELAEVQLRKEVELLWSRWRDSIGKIETEAAQRGRAAWTKRRNSNTAWTSPTRPGPGPGPNGTPASVRVFDFVPTVSPPRRGASPVLPAVPSALSTSLATSTFRHPIALRAQAEQRTPTSGRQQDHSVSGSPPPYSSNPPSPFASSQVLSPTTASSRSTAMPINGEARIRDAYRRNMDESIDIATSYNYVLDVQTQMEESQKEDEREAQIEEDAIAQQADVVVDLVPRGRSPRTGKSAIKKPKQKPDSKSPIQSKRSVSRNGLVDKDADVTTPSKGKRKVTFDVKPEVAIIDGDTTPLTVHGPSNREEAETIFDFEGETGERSEVAVPPLSPQSPVTPTEPVRAPIRHNRTRSGNVSGFPSSLSGLRPTSLPLPSAMRAVHTTRDPPDERPRSVAVRELLLVHPPEDVHKRHDVEEYRTGEGRVDEDMDPREAEILKLVAASTPSHRSAWKKDSKAWRVFVGRQDEKLKKVDKNAIAEEEEDSTAESSSSRAGYYDSSDDEESTGEEQKDDEDFVSLGPQIASSLPIPIAPLKQGRFGVPPMQPKTSLSDRPGVLVPPLHKESSAALRRASYAERDRSRLIDPGTLDFTAEEDEDEDEEVDPDVGSIGGKGRQSALKILKARNEVPAAGMWRSLA